ncbi:MAG: hypothetical protein HC764_03980 [Pleurocapsa sp. CRU_1_2]|nr:hypothetical protein [Pleurocapsa sp. CRU_1_2]
MPIINTEPFSEIIGSRLATFSNLANDSSYLGRIENYQNNIESGIFELLGKGLSAKIETDKFYAPTDAGILYIVIALGWVGAIPFFTGIALLFFKLFNTSKKYLDPFIINLRSIATSIFFLALIGMPGVVASDGMMLVWGFLGVALGGQKYYKHQHYLLTEQKLAL